MRVFFLCGLIAASAFAESPVSFRGGIAPLLQRRCAACHGEESSKGKYRLDTFARLRQPGESALPTLTPGKPEESEIYNLIVEPSANDRMPQKADALPSEEIALIERWIREGAVFDGGEAERPIVELARETLLRAAPEVYPRPMPVTALAFSPDGRQLAVSGYFEVTIWNLEDGALVRRIGGMPERISSLAWGKLLAVAGGSPAQWGGIALVDPAAGWRYLCDLPETALCVAFSRDGKLLAGAGGDRSIRLFEIPGGKPTRIIRQHADWVQTVAFSPDGKLLLSASRDRTARLFNVANGELEGTYGGHGAPLFGAVFLDDQSIVSLARGRSLHVWDVEKREKRGDFKELACELNQIASSPLGLLSAGADHRVRVHSPGDRREMFALFGHDDVVQTLAVAPSGEIFASGSADGTVCVWSLACGTWVQRFVASPLRR